MINGHIKIFFNHNEYFNHQTAVDFHNWIIGSIMIIITTVNKAV